MSYSNLDFVADQLKAAAPGAEWDAAGHDRARELAAILLRSGVRDLNLLAIVPLKVTRRAYAFSEPVETTELAFSYDKGPTFGFMGTPDRWDVTKYFQESGAGPLVAWSAVGHGHVNYSIRPIANRLAMMPIWGSSSDAATIRRHVIGVASVMLAVAGGAGVSAGALIGQAIVGTSIATTYPVATSALGNLVLATAFNGGDVEAAAKGLALSYAAGGAGNFTTSLVNQYSSLDVLGRVAGTAVSTYIRGGDLKDAIQSVVLREAPQVAGQVAQALSTPSAAPDAIPETSTETATMFDSFTSASYFDSSGSFTIDSTIAEATPEWVPDPYPVDLTGSYVWGSGSLPSFDFASDYFSDVPIAETPMPARVTSPVPVSREIVATPAPPDVPATTFDATKIVSGITWAALAALQVVKAYRQLDAPAPNLTARTVTAGGSVIAATSDGMIRTRNPDGTYRSALPAVGVPQTTVDGFVIVNNGDGTYTRISPTGQSQTLRYAMGAGDGFSLQSIIDNPAIVAAVIGGIFFLMRRR